MKLDGYQGYNKMIKLYDLYWQKTLYKIKISIRFKLTYNLISNGVSRERGAFSAESTA